MKAYGIPKIKDVEAPDIVDIKKFGLTGGGKDYFDGCKVQKKTVRRAFKKAARNAGKKLAKELAG